MGKLEQDTVLERSLLTTLLSLDLSFLVIAESVFTASFVSVDVLVVALFLHNLVIDFHSAFIVSIMERTVSNAHESLNVLTSRVLPFALQEGKSSHEISLIQEVFGFRDLLLVHFLLLNGSRWRLLLALDS